MSNEREVYIDPLSLCPFSYSRREGESDEQFANRVARQARQESYHRLYTYPTSEPYCCG